MGYVKFYVGGGTVTARKWAHMSPYYGDSGPSEFDKRYLTTDQLQRLERVGSWESRDIVIVDGDAYIPEKAVLEEASNLNPPAVFDTEERLNVKASNIRTGTNNGTKHYVVADGNRFDHGAEGEEVISFDWNVPDVDGLGDLGLF